MAMIAEDYVSFKTAKLLKEKGFNESCHATYDTAVTGGKPKFSEYEVLSFFPYGMRNTDDKYSMVISAPTLQKAMKWLREVHNLFIFSFPQRNTDSFWIEIYSINKDKNEKNKWENLYCETIDLKNFSTYEEAVEAAIKYCLENLI